MWFYTLRGMKADDIHIAFLCIHWSDICRNCWRREVLYNLLGGGSRKWDGIGYMGLLSSISISISDLNCDSFKMLINSTCGLNILSKQFAC
jgi:hypothetical protein